MWSYRGRGHEGWPVSIKPLKLPYDLKEDVMDQFNGNEKLFNIKVKNLKGENNKDYSPNLDITILIFNS